MGYETQGVKMEKVKVVDWHLAKAVPVTIILGLLLQTVAFVRYAGQLEAQIFRNQTDIAAIKARAEVVENKVQVQEVYMARMDQNIVYTREMVERILNSIERNEQQPR